MRVLLDTCVLSELRQPRGNPAVKAAVDLIPDDALYLSVLTLGEIARGIAMLPAGRKKRSLEAWLTGLEGPFADRILPVDHETARLWGELSARVRRAGLVLSTVDGLLAATALRHGLHFMTRSVPHFAATGVLIVDPWAGP
jgi:toxin FitB